MSLDAIIAFLKGRRSPIPEPVPMSATDIATIEASLGVALPPSLATLLTFDASWLRRNRHGFDATGNLAPRHLADIAAEDFPGVSFEILRDAFPGHALKLEGGDGSETVSALYLGDPDARGEYPVIEIAFKDAPTLDVTHVGLDTWLAYALEIPKIKPKTSELAAARKRILGSTTAVELIDPNRRFPKAVPAPPPKTRSPSVAKNSRERPLTNSQLAKAIEACAADERVERLSDLVAEAKARKLGKSTLTSALLTASREGPIEAMRVLLDAGASANARDLTSVALYWAIRRSKTDVARVKLLLDHGASPKLRGTDAFRTALWNPFVEQLVDLLVAHGGDVTEKESGQHLLRHACYGSPAPPPHAVDVLLERKAPHVADSSGRFPLHWAVWWGHVEHVRRLLAHGIDVNLLTEKSPRTTALAMVEEKRNGPAMVAALRAAGAR